MSICKECGGVGVHHRVDCSHSLTPAEIPPAPVVLPPPPDPFTLGQIVRYQSPGSDTKATYMVVSMVEGEIGLMPLHSRVRVTVDDVEEI